MTAQNRKGPIIDPGLCRCCGVSKRCRLLNVEYEFCGQKEIYSDMFFDCFGLLLSHLDGESVDRLICATCVTRLRDASAFKKQVLCCEQTLLQHNIQIHNEDTDSVKSEPLINLVNKTKKKRDGTKLKRMKKVKRKVIEKSCGKEKLRKKVMKENTEMHGIEYSPQKSPQKTKFDNYQKSHLNVVTLVENSYVCPFDTSFSDYYCIYCRNMFTDPEKLREHTLTHDPTTLKEIATSKRIVQIDITKVDCRLCSITIDNIDTLKNHLVYDHGKVLYDVANDYLLFRLTLNNLHCIECGMSFSFFHALKKHMAEHFGTCICDICGAHYFEERMLVLHQKSHQKIDKTFPCHCGKVFKSNHARYLHEARIHKKEPAYQCSKCDEIFFSYSIRYRHMMETHGEHRLFRCDYCDKAYVSRKSLREHNRRSHLKLFRHQCDLCDKRFYLPSRLKEHMATHTGERNFRCEYCGKSYPRLRGLKVHMQSHSNEKKYRCTMCNCAFTQNVNLKNHVKRQHQNLEMEGFNE